jgi:hypothetical protein
MTLTIDTTAPVAPTLAQGTTATTSKVLTVGGIETGGTVKIYNGSTISREIARNSGLWGYRPNKQTFYHNSDLPRETTPAKWIRTTGFW